MACGLHQISDPQESLRRGSGLLAPARNIIEVYERVNLWWAVYQLDRGISFIVALPQGVDDEVNLFVFSPNDTVLMYPFASVYYDCVATFFRAT